MGQRCQILWGEQTNKSTSRRVLRLGCMAVAIWAAASFLPDGNLNRAVHAQEASVLLDPSTGSPGQLMKVSGEGFSISPCGVNLFFDSVNGPFLGFATIDDGRFSASVTIPPNATLGKHLVIAQGLLPNVEFCGGPSGEIAETPFTVTEPGLDFNIFLKKRVIRADPGIDAAFLEEIQTSSRPTTHAIVQLKRLPRIAQPSSQDDIAALAALGVTLLEYLNGVSGPGTAYLASISRVVQADDPLFGELVRCLLPLEAADKTEPGLLPSSGVGLTQVTDPIEIMVLFFSDVTQPEAQAVFAANGLGAKPHAPPSLWETTASPEQIVALAGDDSVQWIEAGPPPFLPTVDDVRTASNVIAVQKLDTTNGVYGGLSGAGVQIGIMDSGVDTQHKDFAGRIIRFEDDIADHGTHVAGIAAGSGEQSDKTDDAGNSNGGTAFQWRGMAPQADIAAYKRAFGDSSFYSDAINNFGVDVTNHSYVLQEQGLYDAAVASVDSIISGNTAGIPSRPVVWAAANNANLQLKDCDGDGTPETPLPQRPRDCGTAYQAGYFSVLSPCKNCINVGAITNNRIHRASSSMGPTMDGRLKPDVAAIGDGVKSVGADTDHEGNPTTGNGYREYGGTSMASPAVAGIVALALQQYAQTFGVNLDVSPPLPATMKAILVQTAIDLDGTDTTINFDTGLPVTYGVGPDWATGFGLVDALAAVQLIQKHGFVEDEVSLSNVTDEFTVGVAPGQTEVRVTLAWDDLPGAANGNETAPKLINDLDLTLIEPDGTVHRPLVLPLLTPGDCDGNPANGIQVGTCPGADPSGQNYLGPAAEGVDRRNNVEQAVVEDATGLTSGAWTARVSVLTADGKSARLPMGGIQSYCLAGRLNQPICDANGPYEAECAGTTTNVTLDGTGSFDPNAETLSWSWTGPFTGGSTIGTMPAPKFPSPGSFTVNLEVDDGLLSDKCSTVVTITDTIDPVITVPPDLPNVECTSPAGASPALGTATATDICDPSVTISDDAPPVFPLGSTTVTFSATDDSGNKDANTTTVTVVDTTAPVFTSVPDPITVEQTSRDGTPVAVPLAVATDICDTTPMVTSDAPAVFPLGDTTVTFTATDTSMNTTTATTTVTVVDTTPPVIDSLTASPDRLWQPNHQMVPVTVDVSVSDICDAAPSCQLVSVTANELASQRGSGNTAPDWEITGDLTLRLRAERSGGGSGRVYTITVRCTDDSGNSSTGTVDVTVPHDRRRGRR